jgi:cob(I)alamin adenosyltransferase
VAAGGENIPRLYTRAGDRGTTGLAGGPRVDKDSPRIRTYGAYDELGAHLGATCSGLPDSLATLRPVVRRLEQELFIAQGELAHSAASSGSSPRIEARHVRRLEEDIDRLQAKLPPLRSFVLNGGSSPAAALHLCRTVARRAERELWALHRVEPQRDELLQWANRLSDLLFALALAANHTLGVAEVPPDYTV